MTGRNKLYTHKELAAEYERGYQDAANHLDLVSIETAGAMIKEARDIGFRQGRDHLWLCCFLAAGGAGMLGLILGVFL